MNKKDRQKVFDKYGGKCAYCGEDLTKGWHVDEIDPVRRNRKYVRAHFRNKVTKEPKQKGERAANNPDFEWVEAKYIADGCLHPENFNIENQNPSCASCNINKHSGSIEEFRALISGFMKHLNGVNTQYKIAKRYGLVVEVEKPVVFYFEKLENQKNEQSHEQPDEYPNITRFLSRRQDTP